MWSSLRTLSGLSARSAAAGGLWPLEWLYARLDAERARLVLWLPVAFGAGAATYLALVREPDTNILWPVGLISAVPLSRRATGLITRCLCAGVLTFVMGLGYAQWTAWRVSAPVLSHPMNGAAIRGRLIEITPLERGGARLILAVSEIEHWQGPLSPRIRINVKRFPENLKPGDMVRLRGGLMPPPPPAEPGGYDLARTLWFQQIGAVGYAYGEAEIIEDPDRADRLQTWESARLSLAALRHFVSGRIQSALPGAPGGVANALLTGVKGHIPQQTVTELRDVGLAHLLVVAGMHMGFVCGIVFLVVRGGLALIPRIALYHPIKKWAAGATIVVCFGYLALTGAAAPTQRAFTMILVVMTAIMIDRRALSMRLLALGGMVVMIVAPEAVIGPGFQMSFAAVAALIAVYETSLQKKIPSLGDNPFGHAGDHVAAVGLTTIVASLATEPFAAFHFDHVAVYSIPANMIAVPITAFWSMPCGLAALAAMPFGLDAPFLQMMGLGIDVVIRVAGFLAALPAAVIPVPQMPQTSLILIAFGLTWLCLWVERWRFAGLGFIAAALIVWAVAPRPDLILSGDARTIAIRSADGGLKFVGPRARHALAESWMEHDGSGRISELPIAGREDGVACDRLGCTWHRPDGTWVAFQRRVMARVDDCRRAQIVVSPDMVGLCPSARLVIDKPVLDRSGAHALRFSGDEISVDSAWDPDTDRPWRRLPKPVRQLPAGEDAKMPDDTSDPVVDAGDPVRDGPDNSGNPEPDSEPSQDR